MKKLITLSIMILLLAGCSEVKVKKETENLMNNSYTTIWNENINDDLKDEINHLKKEFTNIVMEPLKLNDDLKLSSIKGYKETVNKLDELKKQTEYEITNVQIDKGKATVQFKAKYVNAGSFLTKAISESMDKASLKIYSGEKMSQQEYLENIFESLNKELDEKDFPKTASKEAEITLEKKGNWKATSLNDEALKILTLNFINEKEELKKKAEETKETVFFLETESNLRSVFNQVEQMITSGKISYEDLNKKELIAKIKQEVNVDSAVVDKVGEKENFYYIIKQGEKDLSIIVTRNGERFKFSEKVK